MWWNQLDQEIWERCGQPSVHELQVFDDLDREDLIQCASLYHGPKLKGLPAAARARAAQQQKGWFSLWRRDGAQWLDLLTGLKVSTSDQDVDQVALGRVLPGGEGWELHLISRERLSMAEAEPLLLRLRWAYAGAGWLVGEGAFQVLRHWFRRRELFFGPLDEFTVRLRPRRKSPSLKEFVAALAQPPEFEGDVLVFAVDCPDEESLEDHPLIQRAEKLGEVEVDWSVRARPSASPRDRSDDLFLELDGPQQFTTGLRFPGSLTFKALNKALCCVYGGALDQESFDFELSLDRVVSSDDDFGWDRSFLLLSDAERVHKHLSPGTFFHWRELRLQVLAWPAEPGPSPWFVPGPAAANQRLRRAFHSRLGKLVEEAQPLLPTPNHQPPSRLAGLSQRNLGPLKTKEAMVACLIEAGLPLYLEELANYLQLEGFPLPKGLESLKKAWRRDPVMRQDSQGRVQVVAGAVLMDFGLMERLAAIYDGEEALTLRLEALFGLNALPASLRVVLLSADDQSLHWREWPDGKLQRGQLDEILATLRPEDLLVTDQFGLGAGCSVLELEAGLEDLEQYYLYGCLHGYVLTETGRQPVDWRKESQPDLWEKIYRARKCAQVTLQVRGRETRVLLDPWMSRDANGANLMIKSQFGWEGVAVDEILNLESSLKGEVAAPETGPAIQIK